MKEGGVVRINYVGRLKGSGELFDTTRREVAEEENSVNPNASYGPVPVIVGGEMVVEGLDEQLMEMDVGDESKVTVPPEKAFGKREGDLIKTFSEKKFKDEGMNPAPGMRVNLDGKMGRVLSVNSGRVRVDLNHPLAGKTLNYEVQVEEEIDGVEEAIKGVGKYYFGEESGTDLEDGNVTVKVNEKVKNSIREEFKDKVEEFLDTEVEFEEIEDEGSGENQ